MMGHHTLLLLLLAAATTQAIPDYYCPPGNEGDVVLYPNPDDCTTFYQCSYGHLVLQHCPPGLEYNAITRTCDFPASAGCSVVPSTIYPPSSTEWPTTTRPSTVPPTTTAPAYYCPPDDEGDNFLYPNPDDCTTFYQCSYGRLVLQHCPSGLVYNVNTRTCDFLASAGCRLVPSTIPPSSTALPTTTRPSTTQPTTTAPAYYCPPHDEGDDLLYPNPKDCSTFYQCTWGQLILKHCPNGLDFNPTLKVCDFPAAAGCRQNDEPTSTLHPTTHAPTPTPTPAPTPLPFVCPEMEEGRNVTFFPYPKDCSKYYECDNQVLRVRDCPGVLVFNPDLDVCDHPENVPSCAKHLRASSRSILRGIWHLP